MSKIQGRKYSRYEIKFWYSDLVWDDLITLQVQVDKKNLIKSIMTWQNN